MNNFALMIEGANKRNSISFFSMLLFQSMQNVFLSSYVVSKFCPTFWQKIPRTLNAQVVQRGMTFLEAGLNNILDFFICQFSVAKIVSRVHQFPKIKTI